VTTPRPNPLTYLTDAWLVIGLGGLFGVALAGVHTGLSDRIEENRRNETYSQIPVLAEGAAQDRTVEHSFQTDGKTQTVYQAVSESGETVGWVVPASGQGFADRISLLVGLSASGEEITGIYVLEQKETPGLGDYITDATRFRDQFERKQTDVPLTVTKGEVQDREHEIAALTGATISSDAVADIVNRAIAQVKPKLDELAGATGNIAEDPSHE